MRLLIVGTPEGQIAAAGRIARERGASVAHVAGVEGALADLRAGRGADLLMVDVDLDIARLVASLAEERIAVPVIACGIGAESDLAVAAIRAGAKEYIPLPPDAELIAAVLAAVSEETTSPIHRDPAMTRVLGLADQIAPSDASVLIVGESGTGKEVLARYLHTHSRRATRPLISLNCAAIPDNLLESELFGHEKGAFTGAVSRRIGKFEEADKGTLLLDEVSELHPQLQPKLLRAIQEREIVRVGSNRPIKVDIRLLATSNRDLEEAVRQGSFREDLYFRLNVFTLSLPPLRERAQDIPVLARHFAAKYAESNGLPNPQIETEALDKLRRHPWRGNVRELENTLHRAVLLASEGRIGEENILLTGEQSGACAPAPAAGRSDAGESAAEGAAKGLVGRTVAEVERDLILDTLQHCLGNRTHAANILGISIRTLRNKLRLYSQDGIAIPMPGEAARGQV